LREASQLFLGEDQVVGHGDLEDATTATDQIGLDAELLLDLSRQTGGAGVVVSARAVLDGDGARRGHGVLLSRPFYQPAAEAGGAVEEADIRIRASLEEWNEVAKGAVVRVYRCGKGPKRDRPPEKISRRLDFNGDPEYNLRLFNIAVRVQQEVFGELAFRPVGAPLEGVRRYTERIAFNETWR
jgi:hypothetical protein